MKPLRVDIQKIFQRKDTLTVIEHFEKLKKISSNYKETVDALAPEFEADIARDSRYSDGIKAQRKAERNTRFNAEIDRAAQKAVQDAVPVIAELRAMMETYVSTSDNANTLAAVQALIVGGVPLSDTEIKSFSEKGGFATLKLLEKYTHGRVTAPKLDALEADLRGLEAYFNDLYCYRSTMAPISTNRPWGQAPTTGNVIQKGKIEGFCQKLGELETQWACVFNMSGGGVA